MKWLVLSSLAVALSGCGLVPPVPPDPEVSGEARAAGMTTDILVRPRARPEDLVQAAQQAALLEAAEPVVAEPAAPAGGVLGMTVASLGNPAEPGLWIKTPLVSAEQPGRVRLPDSGRTISVTLLPLDGAATAGSRMSLSAMQQIGVQLTDLPTVEVLLGA